MGSDPLVTVVEAKNGDFFPSTAVMKGSDPIKSTASMNHWKPYEPSESLPWNLARVKHLHRRAAFGATWVELQHDLQEGAKSPQSCDLNCSFRMPISAPVSALLSST
jgi:hypothetical protein